MFNSSAERGGGGGVGRGGERERERERQPLSEEESQRLLLEVAVEDFYRAFAPEKVHKSLQVCLMYLESGSPSFLCPRPPSPSPRPLLSHNMGASPSPARGARGQRCCAYCGHNACFGSM